MKIFATRVWGFDPIHWPVIPFGREGNRDRLLKNSAPGDLIAFVGTQGEPTSENERGRLLGVAEIARIPVDTLAVIDKDYTISNSYDEQGRFKWPKALLMKQAWYFEPQPLLLDVLSAQLPFQATSQAVLLSPEDATAVLALNRREAILPASQALEKARLLDEALSGRRPTTGPIPSSWSGSTGRDVGREAYTYAFRFGKTNIWKIGHSIDVNERLKQVNLHIPTEVLNDQWTAAYQQKWPDENAAYSMEQRVLNALNHYRTYNERLKCTETEVMNAWLQSIGVG